MKRFKKWFKSLELWVSNTVHRWKSNRYSNKFLDCVNFISHQSKDEDRSMLLALFNKEEVEKRLIEIRLIDFLKGVLKNGTE